MWYGALVSAWFWLFGRIIRARRRVRGQRHLSYYGDDRPALLLFLVVRTCWLLVKGTKVTWLLSMWCLSCLSYVNSAVIFWNYFFVHVWFGMSLSKIRSHGGTGGLCGTTMNVANLSEFCSRTAWREKERERERERVIIRKAMRLSPQQERIFLQTEHENAAS